MQDLIDNALLGGLLLAFGFAFIFRRGFSHWLRGEFDKYPPDYFRVTDLIGGVVLCVAGLVLLVKNIFF
jgi:hypothetical protein